MFRVCLRTFQKSSIRFFRASGRNMGDNQTKGQQSAWKNLPKPPEDMTDGDWKKVLNAEQYHVMREAGTERPFTGQYLKNREMGLYKCAACGAPLFESSTKFETHCGWPSFYQAAGAKGTDETNSNVVRKTDNSLGMVRVEVNCKKCGAHLGHVFEDAPEQPTGERFCINGIALDFEAKK